MKPHYSNNSNIIVLVLILLCLFECRTPDREIEPEVEKPCIILNWKNEVNDHDVEYDSLGRLVQTFPNMLPFSRYTYDKEGYVIKADGPNNRTFEYKEGLLYKIEGSMFNNRMFTHIFEYDSKKNLERITTHNYDKEIKSITVFKNNILQSHVMERANQQFQPALIENGRIKKILEPRSFFNIKDYHYYYLFEHDKQGRITKETKYFTDGINPDKDEIEYMWEFAYQDGKNIFNAFAGFKGIPPIINNMAIFSPLVSQYPSLARIFDWHNLKTMERISTIIKNQLTKGLEIHVTYKMNSKGYPVSSTARTGMIGTDGVWTTYPSGTDYYTYKDCE